MIDEVKRNQKCKGCGLISTAQAWEMLGRCSWCSGTESVEIDDATSYRITWHGLPNSQKELESMAALLAHQDASDCRQAFEARRTPNLNLTREGEGYRYAVAEMAFRDFSDGWKAANSVPARDWSDFPHVVCDTFTGNVIGRFNSEAEANRWILQRIADDKSDRANDQPEDIATVEVGCASVTLRVYGVIANTWLGTHSEWAARAVADQINRNAPKPKANGFAVKCPTCDICGQKYVEHPGGAGFSHLCFAAEKPKDQTNYLFDEKAFLSALTIEKTEWIYGSRENLLRRFTKNYEAAKANDQPVDIKALEENLESMRQTNAALVKKLQERESSEREYPKLLSDEEKKDLLKKAEDLWAALQENKLGGFSGINRPFLILNEFKEVIEQFGARDVGLTWSINDLQKANKRNEIEDRGSECSK